MKTKFSPFEEWMSGRRWLKEKAPTEGFHGRYTTSELEVIQDGYLQGWDCRFVKYPENMNENQKWLFQWAYDVGLIHSPFMSDIMKPGTVMEESE